MYLTAMTHRDELFRLTMRWMNDDFHPDDGERISRIFLYESAISVMILDRIHKKSDLRRPLIAHRPNQLIGKV